MTSRTLIVLAEIIYSVDIQLKRIPFVSSAKSVYLQRQKCSSPAQNVLIASAKHVWLQRDPYLEVSSKDYLVTSDECVHL